MRTAVTVTRRGVLLAFTSAGDTLSVARAIDATAPWVQSLVPIKWPQGVALGPTYDPNMVTVTNDLATGATAVSVNEGGAQTGNVPALFVSTHQGTSFTQLPVPTRYGNYQVAMISPSTGIVVGGDESQGVWFTSNAGIARKAVSLPGLVTGPAVSFFGPTAFGDVVYLPVTIGTGPGAQATLYASTDGGSSFTKVLTEARTPGGVVAVNGPNVWWFLGPHRIMESSDGGNFWKGITALRLAGSVASAQLISRTDAVVMTIDSSCTRFKSGCYNSAFQQATNDGGATWYQSTFEPTKRE
ncbi:hypothetical protein [Ferrimicrobium sp.]|uniref:hypothetical protein n=1 Tax=Ferrimicrobium sp. TaxID=2926050 RepID=UPI002635A6FA|nr:hypothetical protein [Ferrimicrobium sp.]